MKVRDLALGLKHLGENEGVEESPVFAILDDATVLSVRSFELERHEDGDGSATVWLRVEEF